MSADKSRVMSRICVTDVESRGPSLSREDQHQRACLPVCTRGEITREKFQTATGVLERGGNGAEGSHTETY